MPSSAGKGQEALNVNEQTQGPSTIGCHRALGSSIWHDVSAVPDEQRGING